MELAGTNEEEKEAKKKKKSLFQFSIFYFSLLLDLICF